jgi:DNA-binding LacI/PurR family transcriptional regulator
LQNRLEEHQDVDGIFAITDLVAVGVLSYFNDNKIKVPQQVAVIDLAIGLCRKYLLQN